MEQEIKELEKLKSELKKIRKEFCTWEVTYAYLNRRIKQESFFNKLFLFIILVLAIINTCFAYALIHSK